MKSISVFLLAIIFIGCATTPGEFREAPDTLTMVVVVNENYQATYRRLYEQIKRTYEFRAIGGSRSVAGTLYTELGIGEISIYLDEAKMTNFVVDIKKQGSEKSVVTIYHSNYDEKRALKVRDWAIQPETPQT